MGSMRERRCAYVGKVARSWWAVTMRTGFIRTSPNQFQRPALSLNVIFPSASQFDPTETMNGYAELYLSVESGQKRNGKLLRLQTCVFLSAGPRNRGMGEFNQVGFGRQVNLAGGFSRKREGGWRVVDAMGVKLLFLSPPDNNSPYYREIQIKEELTFIESHLPRAKPGRTGRLSTNLPRKTHFFSFWNLSEISLILMSPYNNISSSMSRSSTGPNKASQSLSSVASEGESSSSNFSLSKTRKIQRRSNKKKITKIVHTFCFLHSDRDGHQHPFFFQQTSESSIRDIPGVRKYAVRQLNESSLHAIQNAKASTGFAEKDHGETMVKVEAEGVPSVPEPLQSVQFYYIF